MHSLQKDFCNRVKARFPAFFKGKRVLDCGSLDINGNNRYLFTDCQYTGIDVGAGPNVDIVTRIHEYPGKPYDTIISTECFEHDRHWADSLSHISLKLLKPGGLFLFTCAYEGRPEHGTKRSEPADSPFTTDYYDTLILADVMDMVAWYSQCAFEVEKSHKDLYFWGVK